MSASESQITIRTMGSSDADRRALVRLAELDSREPLTGQVLGLQVEGAVLAAIEVTTGKTLADPFSRTDEHRAMLKLRAAQLRGRRAGSRRTRGVLGGVRRGRPAVGGSPPGQIISLPRWG